MAVNPDPRRVVVADDHPPTRAAVTDALVTAGFEVSAAVADGPSAVEAALAERPDVALLDIHMPGSGIVAAAAITDSLPDTAVVMLTVSRGDDDLFDALRAGAAGYLLKDTDPGRLPEAIRAVLRGEAVLPRALLSRISDEFRSREHRRRPRLGSPGANLSSREWEVLALLSEGRTTAEIADQLFIARVTVRSHVAAILKKLRVQSREEAIRLLRDR